MVEFTLALTPGEYVNSHRFRWECSSRSSHGVDILHHVPGNPENTKCLFFFLRLCQRPSRTVFMYGCHSLPSPRCEIPSSPVRGVLSTQPPVSTAMGTEMLTLGCRNSIRVPNHPLQAALVMGYPALVSTNQKSAQKRRKVLGPLDAKQPW